MLPHLFSKSIVKKPKCSLRSSSTVASFSPQPSSLAGLLAPLSSAPGPPLGLWLLRVLTPLPSALALRYLLILTIKLGDYCLHPDTSLYIFFEKLWRGNVFHGLMCWNPDPSWRQLFGEVIKYYCKWGLIGRNKPPGVHLGQVYLNPDPYLSRCFLAASYITCSRYHAV